MTLSLRKPFYIRRKLTGQYVNGFWVEGDELLFQIMATVQPVSGADMQSLPEGRRNSQSLKIYTSTKLNTVENGNPDILLAFDSEYEISMVAPWQSELINHYKCIAYKIRPEDEDI